MRRSRERRVFCRRQAGRGPRPRRAARRRRTIGRAPAGTSRSGSPRRAYFFLFWAGTAGKVGAFRQHHVSGGRHMRGLLLWIMGVPLSVIVLLYLFNVL
ncbi:hypothetical protein D9R14_11740 [Xanthobacter tagetidis]|uniref:Uncharacterized protein n=1 Tax=Xanthobacter tagetidis TaxID=60216 RepID=A0A3L7AFI5_9HYPH|nr:hypothetical protein D9R14_11740 [Xanthobacter tagetidis]